MSLLGSGTSDFPNITGIDTDTYSDMVVDGYLYFQEPSTDNPTDTPHMTNIDDGIGNLQTYISNPSPTDKINFAYKSGSYTYTTYMSIDGDKMVVDGKNITWYELGCIDGATSNIQQQINNINSSTAKWASIWSTTTQTNPTANTVNLVTYNNKDASSNGINYSSSNRIDVSNNGVYLITASFQLNKSSGSTDEEIYVWLRKNGTDISASGYKEFVKSTPKILTANWILTANANDYIQIAWSSPDIHAEFLYIAPSGTPTKPSSPSVLVSINAITATIAGGGGTTNPVLDYLSYSAGKVNVLGANFEVQNGFTTRLPVLTSDQITANTSVQSLNLTITGTVDLGTNPMSIRNNLTNRGDGFALYCSSGSISTPSSIYCDCGSVSWFGTRTYNYYNLLSYIQAENSQTRTILDSVGATANNALTNANNAQNSANNAYNKAQDAQDTADSATAVASSALAAAVASGALAGTTAAGLAFVTGTTIPAIEGQIGTLQGQVSTLQTKTVNMRPTAPEAPSGFNGIVNVYSTGLDIAPQIQLNPFGTSSIGGGLEVVGMIESDSIITNSLSTDSLVNASTLTTGTISTGASGTQNLDGNWINIGHLGSIVTIGGVLYSPFNNPATYWTQFT